MENLDFGGVFEGSKHTLCSSTSLFMELESSCYKHGEISFSSWSLELASYQYLPIERLSAALVSSEKR